jgi:hypothetical protein
MDAIYVVKKDLGLLIKEDVGCILKLNLQGMILIMDQDIIVLDMNARYVENILK